MVSQTMANTNYLVANSAQIIADLGQRFASVRLSQNLTQVQVAQAAGVGEATVARLEKGAASSIETVVRVMLALGLRSHLQALLPDPSIRPIERVRLQGRERRRARPKKSTSSSVPFEWGDENG